MSCVTKNPVNCENLRSITIKQIELDGSITTVVLYFDVSTGESVSTVDAQQCPNIKPLDFTCAIACEAK